MSTLGSDTHRACDRRCYFTDGLCSWLGTCGNGRTSTAISWSSSSRCVHGWFLDGAWLDFM